MKQFTFVLVILVSVISTHTARGQWHVIAPNALTPTNDYGAMCYKDGIIWAGWTNLLRSDDSGKTWKTLNFPTTYIYDIRFFDALHGIIGCKEDAFVTSDGGITWTACHLSEPSRVAFGASPNIMYTLEWASNAIYRTSDGGKNWQPHITGTSELTFDVTADGSLVVVGNGSVLRSSDAGVTWNTSPGRVASDCWTLVADPSDRSQLYCTEEDNSSSRTVSLYASSDGGNSWVMGYSNTDVAGSLTIANCIAFAGTRRHGILRTVDHGASWSSAGGPSDVCDNRGLIALNANRILALDNYGSIWETLNGGDSILPEGTLNLSTHSLFNKDSLTCFGIDTAQVLFSGIGCTIPTVQSVKIIGADSQSYHVVGQTPNSLRVSFQAQHSGEHHGYLVITSSNNGYDTIALTGKGSPSLTISPMTQDQSNDTVGGLVEIPITISGLSQPYDVELSLHYRGDLLYQGSYDANGNRADIPLEEQPGRSRIRIQTIQPNSTAAYARFSVFTDTTVPQVTFDSIVILSMNACVMLEPTTVTSTITPPTTCGSIELSQVVHGGMPSFSIRPNPTNGQITIESSKDIDNATIDIYDALGVKQLSISSALKAGSTMPLLLPLTEGIYVVRINSPMGSATQKIVIKK